LAREVPLRDKGKRVRAVRDKELEHMHDNRRLWEALLFLNGVWGIYY
jgi:hypothetical protein